MQEAGIVEKLRLLGECWLGLAGDQLCSDGLFSALVIVLSSLLLFLLELSFILRLLFKLNTITFLRVLKLHRFLLPELPLIFVDFPVMAAGEQLSRYCDSSVDVKALHDKELLLLLNAPDNHLLG